MHLSQALTLYGAQPNETLVRYVTARRPFPNFVRVISMFSEIRRSREISEPSDRQAPEERDERLAQLQEQEQLWFSWVTVLHERLTQVRPDDALVAEGRKVLEIARQRWLGAKEALREYHSGD